MSLNVVGLISGGKDSLFSLAHCLRNGHKLIALANLHPNNTATADRQTQDDEGSDLDSFMYQTVGHSVVPLYQEALGVPLYRRPITGTAIQNGRYYDTDAKTEVADEIEDMYALVKEVMEHHPEVNALSAGAILSTYQRTRVESVAVRLGLIPLAYLWQYPALPPPLDRKDSLTGLLDDMEKSGCEARIIKIASGGVPAKLALSSVSSAETRTKLVSGMAPFFNDAGQEFWLRGAVLGEGGEYETLALDGPDLLWKKKICINSHGTYEVGGGASYVRLGKAFIADREVAPEVKIPEPASLDQRFAAVQSRVTSLSADEVSQETAMPVPKPDTVGIDGFTWHTSWNNSANTVQVVNLTSSGMTAGEQLEAITENLSTVLGEILRSGQISSSTFEPRALISTMLLLQSMDDFALANEVYVSRLWPYGMSNPPARVTVAAPLPKDVKVSLSLIYDVSGASAKSRKGLHVQSRSYWAPANIGPYSQAICVPVSEDETIEIVQLAGQIPLVPSTMVVLDAPFIEQAVLALQHLWRVAQERGVDKWAGAGVAFLAHPNIDTRDDSMMLQRARDAAHIWTTSHRIDERGNDYAHGKSSAKNGLGTAADDENEDDDEDVDIWDLQQRFRGFSNIVQKTTVGEHLHKLPNTVTNAVTNGRSNSREALMYDIPPFIAVEVVGLPRNAPIEWWSTGLSGLVTMAGSPTTKVSAISAVSSGAWTLTGVSVEGNSGKETRSAEERYAEYGEGVSNVDNRRLRFFMTLLIDSTAKSDQIGALPHSLDDLVPYLLEDSTSRDMLRWQVSTAQSFINLRCPVGATTFTKLQLFQDSCRVLCQNVWTSNCESIQARLHESVIDNTTSRTNGQSGDVIREVAAAIVLRIDAIPKSR